MRDSLGRVSRSEDSMRSRQIGSVGEKGGGGRVMVVLRILGGDE